MNPLPPKVLLAGIIALALILASVPYLAGIRMQPEDGRFLGLTWNIDDACVYISWIRQIADGHVLFMNRYTNDPQRSLQFNLLFAIMGLASRVSGLSPAAVLHVFRLLIGAGLLLTAWRFAGLFFPDERKRLLFIGILAFSSGFGWFLPERGHQGPIDTWQPEAITFLSLYLNPLFLAGQILMLGALYFLFQITLTGHISRALLAGLMLLLLANIHSYDIITIGAVWAAYLILLCVLERRIIWKHLALSTLAGIIMLPTLGYQLYLYRVEEVFRLRANTPAPSPALISYFLGYGLVLVGAVFGLPHVLKTRKGLLLVVWAVIGFILPYLPIAQQRKLVMGLHIPLCLLAATALWRLRERMSWRNARTIWIALILVSSIGNLHFIRRDIRWLRENLTAPRFRAFLSKSEMRAFAWLRENTRPSDAVFAPPDVAVYIPAIAGNRVYYGHWSETPNYVGRMREWLQFARPDAPEPVRAAILRNSRVRYVLDIGIDGGTALAESPLLIPVFRDGPVVIYRTSLQAHDSPVL